MFLPFPLSLTASGLPRLESKALLRQFSQQGMGTFQTQAKPLLPTEPWSILPAMDKSQASQDAPKTVTGVGGVPPSKVWLTHGCCTLGTSVLLRGCPQSNVALLPHPKPLLCCAELGKPEATLELGSVGLELLSVRVMPVEREGQTVLLHWI